MLLVPTYVAPSAVEGVGIFAAEDIPEGAMIWQLEQALDRLIPASEVASQPESVREFIERYAYPYARHYRLVVELDNGSL